MSNSVYPFCVNNLLQFLSNLKTLAVLMEGPNMPSDSATRSHADGVELVAPVSPESWIGYWIKRLFPWAVAALARTGARRQLQDAGSG